MNCHPVIFDARKIRVKGDFFYISAYSLPEISAEFVVWESWNAESFDEMPQRQFVGVEFADGDENAVTQPLLKIEKDPTFVASIVDRGVTAENVYVWSKGVFLHEVPNGRGDGFRVLLFGRDMTKETTTWFANERYISFYNSLITWEHVAQLNTVK